MTNPDIRRSAGQPLAGAGGDPRAALAQAHPGQSLAEAFPFVGRGERRSSGGEEPHAPPPSLPEQPLLEVHMGPVPPPKKEPLLDLTPHTGSSRCCPEKLIVDKANSKSSLSFCRKDDIKPQKSSK